MFTRCCVKELIVYKYIMTLEDLAKTIRIEGTSNSTILPRAIGPRENGTFDVPECE